MVTEDSQMKEVYGDYLDCLVKKGLCDKTIVEHKRFLFGALSHSIQDIKIKDLRMVDVIDVIEAGKKHGRYGSQRSVVDLRLLLKYIEDLGIRLSINWRNIRIPKVPPKPVEYLTDKEIDKVRGCFNINDLAGLRMRALLELLIDTGARISEAISIDKECINYENKEVTVKNAKNHEIEKVYLTNRSIYWIKRYLSKRKDNLPCLFVSGRGRLLSVTSRNFLRVHTKHLKLGKHIRHHIFRRTLATKLIQENADIKSVQTLLRHKSPRTTLSYYVGIDKEKAKEIHQGIMSKLC